MIGKLNACFVVAVCCLVSLSACAEKFAYDSNAGLIAVRGFQLFYDSAGPLSYQTFTPRDVPDDAILLGRVTGDSCQYGVSIPIPVSGTSTLRLSGAKGDGSYRQAILDIQRKHPDIAGLYDVIVDIRKQSILRIYSRECTKVVARAFARASATATPALSSRK